jgi:hypothetical protein
MADRMPHDLYPVAPSYALAQQQPDYMQLLTIILHQLAAQVDTLSLAAAPTHTNNSANPTTEFDDVTADKRHEHDARPAESNDNPIARVSTQKSGQYTLPERSLSAWPP